MEREPTREELDRLLREKEGKDIKIIHPQEERREKNAARKIFKRRAEEIKSGQKNFKFEK